MTDPSPSGRRLALGLAALLALLFAPRIYNAVQVYRAVAHNIEARGGQAAWDQVQALRFTGSMDIGHGLSVPFVLEQARPDQSCLSYEFQKKTILQCTNGAQGWKEAPFTGREGPTPLSPDELREATAGADPRGMLIDYADRGHAIHYEGTQDLDGRPAIVLEVTLPQGATRTVYLDEETGLELKITSTRTLLNKVYKVDTTYSDWAPTEGVLFSRRQSTQTEGDTEAHTLEILTLQVNPTIDPARFVPPGT